MPNAKPSVTSWSTNFHHTKPWSSASAAVKARTAGSARPSLSPDSRLSEWRTILGTRGFVTTEEESTGSVGDSSAPSSADSSQPSPTIQWAAPATTAPVIGIPSTSLRNGRCHSRWSLSASTSSPSRNRITTRATIARSCTNPERAPKSSTSKPPSPSTKPVTTKSAASDRNDRRTSPATRAPTISRPPNTSSTVSRLTGLESASEIHRGGGPHRRAHHRARQVAVLAGRGRSLQRLPDRGGRLPPAARLRQRRVLQAAAVRRLRRRRRGRDLASARGPLPRPGPVLLRADLRAAPEAGAGRRRPPCRPPVPVGGSPGTDGPACPELQVPPGARELFRRVVGAWGNADLIENAFEMREYDSSSEIEIGPVRITFQPVPHFTETFAMSISSTNGSGRIVYGADSSPTDALTEF